MIILSLATATATAKTLNGFKISKPLVSSRLIQGGGPPRDGIPALDAPRFIAADDATNLADTDRVIGLHLDDIAKAYPIRIMNYHEIVNDYFDDRPVAITFCPLCGTGIAFDAVANGIARRFGVSGLLYNSDVLMYDRETESLWSQILGQAVNGPSRGQELKSLPVLHTTWADWRRRHPDSLVLAEPSRFGRDYDVDPYLGYANTKEIWFPVAKRDQRYPAKSVVIGAVIDGRAYAWPFAELPENQKALTTRTGDIEVTLDYDAATRAARLTNTNGNEIPSFTAYWFAWIAFHPKTEVWTRD
jgi:hypothetical protein